MPRRDLTNKEIEEMGRQEPGSAARYLEERRAEIAADKQAEREEDDKERWIAAFVRAGGSPQDARSAYKAFMNERAQEAARAADAAAGAASRRRMGQVL
jgi:hypothetical protein